MQFCLLAEECKDETDYIKKAEELINNIRRNPKLAIDDFFFENQPSTENLVQVLQRITKKIEKVKQIPIEKRHFEF